jgi:hypothetical protein
VRYIYPADSYWAAISNVLDGQSTQYGGLADFVTEQTITDLIRGFDSRLPLQQQINEFCRVEPHSVYSNIVIVGAVAVSRVRKLNLFAGV